MRFVNLLLCNQVSILQGVNGVNWVLKVKVDQISQLSNNTLALYSIANYHPVSISYIPVYSDRIWYQVEHWVSICTTEIKDISASWWVGPPSWLSSLCFILSTQIEWEIHSFILFVVLSLLPLKNDSLNPARDNKAARNNHILWIRCIIKIVDGSWFIVHR